MRLLLDVHGLGWDEAWEITRRTFAYTNHTLLPEALETWPVELFGSLLPRHLQIVYEINRHFLEEVRVRFPGDEERVGRMSLIDEGGPRSVRMAHLASVGSHAINGVAALHTDLLKRHVLRDFQEMWPGKIRNVTNGVTPRRFVALINPGLAGLVTEAIGDGWLRDLDELRELEPLAEDAAFREDWRRVKGANKEALAAEIEQRAGVDRRPREPLRRPGQADPRVQAAAPERPPRDHPLPAAEAGPGPGRPAAHRDLRGQGRPRLLHGQADHQAHPRGGSGRQRRPRRAGPAAGRLPARLQRQELPAHLPGRRPLRADLHRGEGGLGHREHEVRPERGPDHRHPGRRQRGDPRGGGATTTSSSSGSPWTRCRQVRAAGYQPGRVLRRRRASSGPPWTPSPPAISPTETGRSSGPSWRTSSTTTPSSSWPTTAPTWTPRARWRRPGATGGLDPGLDPERRPVRALLLGPVDLRDYCRDIWNVEPVPVPEVGEKGAQP